jgi:3-hydroxyisobutyrate dehydrogenase-like beta-hydroxyacid dehydrogenase
VEPHTGPDGAIIDYPVDIGTPDGKLLFAGPKEVYTDALSLLGCLGGDLRYLGANIAAASTVDMALLIHESGNAAGIFHAATLWEAENVGVDVFASMLPAGQPAARLAGLIHQGDGAEIGATIAVWNSALQRIRSQARDAGITTEVPDFMASPFDRALAEGMAEQDLVSLIQLFRTKGRHAGASASVRPA